MPVDAYEISFNYKPSLTHWEPIGVSSPFQSVQQPKNSGTIRFFGY